METVVKVGFAQISLAAQKIWVTRNLGGRGVLQPPHPHQWVLSPVFSIKHRVSVKLISEKGLQFVPSLKRVNRFWTQISNKPPQEKFRWNIRRLKRFPLFWNGSNNTNTEIELRTNEHHRPNRTLFPSQYVTFGQDKKILWPRFLCAISLNLSETLVCWSVRASLANW